MTDDAEVIVTAYGAASRICKAAVSEARKRGVKAGLLRPKTLWPFPVKDYKKTAKTAKRFLCVEIDDVKLAVECSLPVDFFGKTGGIIPTSEQVIDKLTEINGKL